MAQIETREYLTCRQAGQALNLAADTVRRYLLNAKENKTPALQGLQVGRDWLIHKTEVNRYKKERRNRGRSPST